MHLTDDVGDLMLRHLVVPVDVRHHVRRRHDMLSGRIKSVSMNVGLGEISMLHIVRLTVRVHRHVRVLPRCVGFAAIGGDGRYVNGGRRKDWVGDDRRREHR